MITVTVNPLKFSVEAIEAEQRENNADFAGDISDSAERTSLEKRMAALEAEAKSAFKDWQTAQAVGGLPSWEESAELRYIAAKQAYEGLFRPRGGASYAQPNGSEDHGPPQQSLPTRGNSGREMSGIGQAMLGLGLCLLMFFFFFFDVSVGPRNERIVNLDRLNIRQIGVIAGACFSACGVILYAAGEIVRRMDKKG